MSLELCRREDLTTQRLAELERALAEYYRNPPPEYYQMADEAWQHFSPIETPFHCDLVERIFKDASVLELGCGTAPLCPHVEGRGATYTGIDYGEQLIAENRRRFPRARFYQLGSPLEEQFDFVVSLYTIEHVADPPAYLEQMWNYCRPGGCLAIICPEFVETPVLPPSFLYGRTPRRLREKIRSMSLVDAALHLGDLKIRGPNWKARARASPAGAFWMNLRPRILYGAEYSIDADAVHLARRRDLEWFWKQKGAAILQTSEAMPHVSPEVLRYNCYVVAQKPEPVGKHAAAKTRTALHQ